MGVDCKYANEVSVQDFAVLGPVFRGDDDLWEGILNPKTGTEFLFNVRTHEMVEETGETARGSVRLSLWQRICKWWK